MKKFLLKVYKKCVLHKWEIGFIDIPLGDILDGTDIKINWVKHRYTDRWFADPFILTATPEEIVLLVEEYQDKTKLGRISKLIIDRPTLCIKKLIPILELESHLSFPAILKDGDNIFIYPENSQSGDLKLYKYNPEADLCSLIDTIIEEPLTDAVITTIGDHKYIISTLLPNPNGNEVNIYSCRNKTAKFEYSLKFNENIARNAGAVFFHKGKMYRPAQLEKDGMYGKAISLQRINIDDDNRITFEEIQRIKSPSHSLDMGFHTFNVYDDLIVVDAKGFRHPLLGKFCYFLKHLFGYK